MLPELILDTSAGPVNTALRERVCRPPVSWRAGCSSFPTYGHNRRRDATVFDEGQGTCVTKPTTGVGIGDSEGEVQRIYGDRTRVEPHPYNEEGRYLILRLR